MNTAYRTPGALVRERGRRAVWLGILLAARAATGCVTHAAEEPIVGDAMAGSGPVLDAREQVADAGDATACATCDATIISSSPDGAAAVEQGDAEIGPLGADSTTVGDTAMDERVADGPDETALGREDGSASGCAGLFCEDFEKAMIDPAIWNVQASGGQTVAVETSVVAHGKYAIQFHANPNLESYDFIITKNAPAALQGHHFGRAYFNVTPKPPTEHAEFLFAGTAGFPNLKYLEVASVGTPWQLTYVDLIGNTGESYASGGVVPDARWFCLEWEFNDTPDQATVFVDGVQSYSRSTIAFQGQSTGLVGGFKDFGFGYYDWHPVSYPFDVYYDDIVLDTKRVGCLAAP
jgi:hypothetical protein